MLKRALALHMAAALLISAYFSAAAAKEGAFCGGIAGAGCDPGEYCAYGPGMCPGVVNDASGVCKVRLEACPEIYSPVCGCDGRTYGSECEAAAHSVSIMHPGECEAN